MAFQLLFADDSATMHRVVQITLAREDIQVLGVHSGRDAVMRARDRRPDIAVLDVSMPDMDGYAACQALKDDPSTSHIPVLLLASTQEPLDAQRAQDCGADGHLTKPFDTQGFIDKIKQTLSQAPQQAAPQAFAPSQAPRAPQAPAQGQAQPPADPTYGSHTQAQTQAPPGWAAPAHAHPPAGASHPALQATPRPQPQFQAQPQAQARPQGQAAPFAGTTSPAMAATRQPHASTLPHAHIAQSPVPPPNPAASARTIVPQASSAAPQANTGAGAWKVPIGAGQTPPAQKPQSPTARVPLPAFAHAQGHVTPVAQTPRPHTAAAQGQAAPSAMTSMTQRMAAAAAPAAVQAVQRAQPATGGLDTAELMAAAKEILERVAWEVVPPMAESMIREHIERLARR